MARIRSVHPSLFTDEAWVSCSPLARILYIGLWTDADDQGLFEWKPLQIKMRLLPGDSGEVSTLLDELASVDLVQAYDVGGKKYGAIANFRKFQRPQKPNAIHPITDFIAEYVCMPVASTELVGDQYDTDPVNPPQMEDGGGRGEETAKSNDLSVTRTGGFDFEGWWKLYPNAVAKPKARQAYVAALAKIGGPDPDAVLRDGLIRSMASARWADPTHTRPNPATWLVEERWADRHDGDPAAPRKIAAAWAGPAEIRAAVVSEKGEAFAASYLDPAGWTDAGEVVAATGYAAEKLRALTALTGRRVIVRPAIDPSAQDAA